MIRKTMVGLTVITAIAAMTMTARTIAQQGSATRAASPTMYHVDPMHSSIVFRIKHIGAAYVYGMFEKMDGQLHVTDDDVPKSVELTIETASVDTNVDARDNHLRNPDFFNVEEHPTITFKSTSIEPTDADDGMGKYTVTGELTMLGTTKPVTAGLDFVGRGEMRGTERVGVEAVFTIQRSAFGMTYGVEQGTIGDDVTLMVALEGYRKKAE